MKNYQQKLKDPRWQKKRLLIMERDNWSCVQCGSTTIELNVHHKKYIYGNDPWEYEDNILETLCRPCHQKEHDLIPEIEIERKYEHLIILKEEAPVIQIINNQLLQLQNKLKENISDELMQDILGNIVFLQNKKKEFKF